MFIDPSGEMLKMDGLLPYLQKLPLHEKLYGNLIFSGIALLIVNGITNLTAAAFLFAKKPAGHVLATIFGVTLMAWITIQFCIMPTNFMSISYFIFGAIQFATGVAACVFSKQENFAFCEEEYPNVGKDGKILVVFFSRMGYVKKLAYGQANELKADICEIKSTENTCGTRGFWWCGRYAMHRWDMPIELVSVDLSHYEKVVICTPVWVFDLAAPVRTFCKIAAGKIKSAEYVVVHNTRNSYRNVAEEMNKLLGVCANKVTSVRCKCGNIIKTSLF